MYKRRDWLFTRGADGGDSSSSDDASDSESERSGEDNGQSAGTMQMHAFALPTDAFFPQEGVQATRSLLIVKESCLKHPLNKWPLTASRAAASWQAAAAVTTSALQLASA